MGVGPDGLILRTTDGGATWSVIPSPTDQDLMAVHFYDADTGYIAGGTEVIDGFILKTTDGGLTWKLQDLPTIYPQYAVRTTGSSAFCGGWSCLLFGTENGGIPVYTEPKPIPAVAGAQVFPNPFTDQAQVRFTVNEPSDVEISLFDLRGTEICHRTFLLHPAGKSTYPLPCRELEPGIYFCRIRVGNHTETKKIVRINSE